MWWKIALGILALIIVIVVIRALTKPKPTQTYVPTTTSTPQQGINVAQFGSLLGSLINNLGTKDTSTTGTTTSNNLGSAGSMF